MCTWAVGPLLSKVDPMLPWYGPLIRDPYKPTIDYNTIKNHLQNRDHRSEPVKEGEGSYQGQGPIGKPLDALPNP